MEIALSNRTVIFVEKPVKHPRAEGIEYLTELKKREERGTMTKQIEEMTAEECWNELDRLRLYRQKHGRGRNPDAYQARHYYDAMKKKVKARLKELGATATRPGDRRCYGPGCAKWQQAGAREAA